MFYFKYIQFCMSTHFSFIWQIDRTLLGGPGSDHNKGVLHIPKSSSITRISPSDCLAPYQGHSFGWGLTSQHRSSRCILQPQPTRQPIYIYRLLSWYLFKKNTKTRHQFCAIYIVNREPHFLATSLGATFLLTFFSRNDKSWKMKVVL